MVSQKWKQPTSTGQGSDNSHRMPTVTDEEEGTGEPNGSGMGTALEGWGRMLRCATRDWRQQ